MSLRRGDHQTGACGHSPPELPHREVESGLRAQEHGVIGVQSILRGDPVELVDDRGVRHRNAFGSARGPGRVDDVRRVVRPQRSQAVALLHRRRGDSRQIEATDIERLGRLRQSRRSLACHQGEHGPGVVDYVGDAVQRMVRVDGQVGAAGNGDRVHRHHQVDRPRHRKSDSGFRADPTVDQDPGQRVHPDSQVAVRQRGAVIGLERDVFCVVAHRLRQSGRERARRQHHSGVVATTDQFTLLSTGEHRQVTDGNERLVDDLVDQRDEAVGDRAHRLRVEQVVGVGEHRVESGRLSVVVVVVRQDQMQVELCDALGHLDGFDAQAGEVEAGALDVLERQADLEDRMVGGRTHRIEYLDEAFERHIGVGERFGVTIADGVQERTETAAEIDLGPHGEGVDEHADDTFDLALDPSAHRRTDGDVGVAAQSREQQREGAVEGHERTGAPCACQVGQAAMGLGRDRERRLTSAQRLHRRTRPVGGQFQLVGDVREVLLPELDLGGQHAGRIRLVTEQLTLPDRVVGVLHRQRRPLRSPPGRTRVVGDREITDERHHRLTVGRHVVHHHRQHMTLFVQSHQRDSHGHGGGDVEAPCHEPGQLVEQRVLGGVDHLHLRGGLLRRQDHLMRSGRRVRVDGPERFVSRDDVVDRAPQCCDVEIADQRHRGRDVVGNRFRVEAVEEPHAGLGQRQRDPDRAWSCHQRRAVGTYTGPGGQALGEFGDGRRGEQLTHPDLPAEGGPCPADDLGGTQ